MNYGRVFVLFILNNGFLSFIIEIVLPEPGAQWAKGSSPAGQIPASCLLGRIVNSQDTLRLFWLSRVAVGIN